MKKLSCTIAVIFSLIFSSLNAQHEAPTLQAGLNGISFSRGNLDAALIAEIIAEKQRELKTRLIKEMLLNSLGVDNGLFYGYIDNTIDIIANEKDEKTRVNNLLENTVNLAFVITYTEYYLFTLQENTPQIMHLRKLAFAYALDSGVIKPKMSLRDITQKQFPKVESGSRIAITPQTEKDQRNQFLGVLLDIVAEAIKNNDKLKALGLLRTSYLQNQTASNAYLMVENDGSKKIQEFNSDEAGKSFRSVYKELGELYADKKFSKLSANMLAALKNTKYDSLQNHSAEIAQYYAQINDRYNQMLSLLEEKAKTNNTAKEVLQAYYYNGNYRIKSYKSSGLDSLFIEVYGINPSVINRATHPDTSLYKPWSNFYRILDLQYKYGLFSQIFDKKSTADEIVGDVGNQLDLLIKYFGIIKTLASKGTNVETVWNVLEANYKCGADSTDLFNTIVNKIDSARKSIGNVAQLAKEDLAAFNTVNSFIDKLKLVEANRYEYMAQFESEVKPALLLLSKYSQEYLTIKDLMFQRLLCYATQAKTELSTLGLDIGNSFINLLVSIDEFDEPATFQKYLNHLADAGDVFSNPKMRSAINIITAFVRSYISVSQDTANHFVVNIDAEGFITSLQKLNYNKFSPWGLHFTVGTNTAAFNRPLTLSDGSTINNYSFIGEKIGVKFKLYDNQYLKSFSRGETFTYWRHGVPFCGKTTYVRNAPPSEPILSNVHLLAYGSGVLYNLVNTGTTANFNSPLVGAGLGLTFFNGLDINASIGTAVVNNKPFLDKSVPFYFNFGMDIQFVEYIDRLNKKRRDQQTQKKLTQAAQND